MVVVVLNGLYQSKRIIVVRWADLSDFFGSFSSMCVFVSRPMKLSLFFGETITPQTGC